MRDAPTQRYPGIVKAMSLLFLTRCLIGVSFLVCAGWSFYKVDSLFLGISGGILVLMTILMGIQLAENGACRCAVCTTPIFQATRSQSGNTSPRAKAFGGSRRIYRSLSVLAGGYYHCNHCGEKISCNTSSASGSQPTAPQATHVPQMTKMRSLPARRA